MLITIRAISHDYVNYFHLVLNVCRAKCLVPECLNCSRNHYDSPSILLHVACNALLGRRPRHSRQWMAARAIKVSEKETVLFPAVSPGQRRSLRNTLFGLIFK
ncbi:hypothetical protein CEXT_202361 [Caerostris extrusa]|uniref:Uncharacterized protein n=1 Tax=Caerostris extrusa TaxID=172846 RepID=A0AAV4R5A3_CAEEX|nr:hypothetical protein CEXT_202361 [Caerostris extrusa]